MRSFDHSFCVSVPGNSKIFKHFLPVSPCSKIITRGGVGFFSQYGVIGHLITQMTDKIKFSAYFYGWRSYNHHYSVLLNFINITPNPYIAVVSKLYFSIILDSYTAPCTPIMAGFIMSSELHKRIVSAYWDTVEIPAVQMSPKPMVIGSLYLVEHHLKNLFVFSVWL